MTTRLYNARILTMAEGYEPFWGEIWIENDKILYAGPEKPSDMHWDVQRNINGNLVLPGFKNAHTHSAMTFLRSYADDLPLQDWLNTQVFPMEAKLDAEMI